ncbi:MAG: B12-binding domain-containing radical SAM protein [Bacteroidia bacterium]|nr:B12-binding domain-containing radical SAM protein [Bacteroidia bacterium]
MRILLVYPEMPDTFYALKHFIKVVGKKAAFPPLGLLTISSLLPAGWEKKLIDLNVTALTDAHLQWADYVFLSAMNVQEQSVREILSRCAANNTKVVAGGPLFTHEHERFEGVAHFILNEAEITLPLFINDVQRGEAKPLYQTKAFADVTLSPLPDFGLVNMKNYLYAIVQYSRGCPYLCDFCDVTALFGRVPRTKTPEQIITELEAVNSNGNVQLVLFADDNLIGNKKILKTELLPALIKWRKEKNPSFFFATQLTVNLADDEELMQLLLDAGFRHVFIGIETPQEDSLKGSHKNQNLKRNLLQTIHTIHQKGFIISGGFIAGFDTDTGESFKNLADFIQQSGIPLPIVNLLKAPPGTELYQRIKRENRLSRAFAFAEGETNIVPAMGEEKLFNGFQYIIDQIYLPQHSFERLKTFFKNHRFPATRVKIRSRFSGGDVISLIQIFIRMGLLQKQRSYFWKLFWWTLRYNRRFMDKAVFYGIMMYQMNQTYHHIRRQLELNRAGQERG